MSHPKVIHPRELMAKELGGLDTFHQKFAINLSNILSSIYFFYFCLLLDALELPGVVNSHSVIIWISYISQTVIQLVALPILAFASKIIEKNGNAKADSDHQALTHIALTVDAIKAAQDVKSNN